LEKKMTGKIETGLYCDSNVFQMICYDVKGICGSLFGVFGYSG